MYRPVTIKNNIKYEQELSVCAGNIDVVTKTLSQNFVEIDLGKEYFLGSGAKKQIEHLLRYFIAIYGLVGIFS
jgi:hypothetical protein